MSYRAPFVFFGLILAGYLWEEVRSEDHGQDSLGHHGRRRQAGVGGIIPVPIIDE